MEKKMKKPQTKNALSNAAHAGKKSVPKKNV